MTLKMPGPIRDRQTGVFRYKRRIPADLLGRLKGTKGAVPVGEKTVTFTFGDFAEFSLRTKDAPEAKTRFVIADAALTRFYESTRSGPIRLSNKQVVAFAGLVYRAFVEAAENNPVDPGLWESIRIENLRAAAGVSGRARLLIATQEEKRRFAMEKRFGPMTDTFLRREALIVDDDSRSRLIEAVGRAFDDAATVLQRYAHGDYSPDPDAARYPEWDALRPSATLPGQPQAAGLKLSEVVEKFKENSPIVGKSRDPKTLKRYDPVFRRLCAFLQDPPIQTITADDLRRFRQQRLEQGMAKNTVHSVEMVAIRAFFGWASSKDEHPHGPYLSVDPACEIRIPTKASIGAVGQQHPGFFDHEWKAILRAALATRIGSANPSADRAFRWVPWIAAYTGARITSLCSLAGSDFVESTGVKCIRLPPEKRNPSERYVPIHPHLLEMGIWDMASEVGDKLLFVDLGQKQPQSLANDVRNWTHKVAAFSRKVSPCHAWRSTFLTRAADIAGIPESHAHYFAGQSHKNISTEWYRRPPMSTFWASMQRVPRYEL